MGRIATRFYFVTFDDTGKTIRPRDFTLARLKSECEQINGVANTVIIFGSSAPARVSITDPAWEIFATTATRYSQPVARRGKTSLRKRSAPNCAGQGVNAFLANSDNNVAEGAQASVLGGESNLVCDDESIISGGALNIIDSRQNQGQYSFIGAGRENEIVGPKSFIGAGFENKVISSSNSAIVAGSNNVIISAPQSFIGAGIKNMIASTQLAFIGGGVGNVITAVSHGEVETGGAIGSTILGGAYNRIAAIKSAGAGYAFIGGGYGNTITGDGEDAVVGGGRGNIATGTLSTIPGGFHNLAQGELSFAAGYFATSATPGSFVWADFSPGAGRLTSTAPNEFLARATGGFTFFTDATLKTGVTLAPGSGAWSSVSDRNLKTDIDSLDAQAVLRLLMSVPVTEWSYISEPGVRHVGPMSQDFFSAFGVGEDNRHISTIDEDGVALAAIEAVAGAERELAIDGAVLSKRVAYLQHGEAGSEVRLTSDRHTDTKQKVRNASSCSGPGANSFLANSVNNIAAGAQASVGGGIGSDVCDDNSAVAGGSSNAINSGNDTAILSFIAGGQSNLITGSNSFIGAGSNNSTITDGAVFGGDNNETCEGFVGSGMGNRLCDSAGSDAGNASIGGGSNNRLVGGSNSAIVGGMRNVIVPINGGENDAFIGGGQNNQIRGTKSNDDLQEPTIVGGDGNILSGQFGAIAGGYSNVLLGDGSFAAGYAARSAYPGTFIWSDYSPLTGNLTASRANQFLVRASGGVKLITDLKQSTGVVLAPGSGTWSSASDRSLKTMIRPIDQAQVLKNLEGLPVTSWSYLSEPGVRHIGPMADDFFSSFKVGEDNRHISTVDEDGIALLAIQALKAELEKLRYRNVILAGDMEKVGRAPQTPAEFADFSKRRSLGRRIKPRDASSCSGDGANSFRGNTDGNIASGAQSSVVAGMNNSTCDDDSTIDGGTNNLIATAANGGDSFDAAGSSNVIAGERSFVGAGNNNTLESSADAAISVGSYSLVQNSPETFLGSSGGATIVGASAVVSAGGAENTVSASHGSINEANGAFAAVLASGGFNSIQALAPDGAELAVLGGGGLNVVNGSMAVLMGGAKNSASGYLATIPGGMFNIAAGELSFAAGSGAQAETSGSFVWGDSSTNAPVTSLHPNQFVARATGGVIFFSDASMTTGVTLAPGSGTWSSASDRGLKNDVRQIDERQLLERVVALPISRWSYRSEPKVRHAGPMAEDFFAAFKIGEDDRHIAVIDEDGVVLAAVRALAEEVNEVAAEERFLQERVTQEVFSENRKQLNLSSKAWRLGDESI